MKVDNRKVRLAMARLCMDPKDLATAADMPPQTINGALRERSIRPATLGRIAKALGVDVSEIVKEE